MLVTIIVFIIILGVLILVHELGHFFTARRAGVKVEEFGFGFPPRVLGWQRQPGESKKWKLIWGNKKIQEAEQQKDQATVYSLNWIPLGGFVKIKGEGGEARDEPDSFSHQPFGKRGLILSAGVLKNVFLAFILLAFGFMIGLPAIIDGEQLADAQVRDKKIQITNVAKDSPAADASLQPLDQILEIGGQSVTSVEQVQSYIKEHQDQLIKFKIKDALGVTREIDLKPAVISGLTEDRVVGINLAQTAIVRYGFFASIYRGFLATINLLIQIILAFYFLIKSLLIGSAAPVEVAGPVGVAVMTGQVVNLGFNYIINFTALLSLNLAIINFIPFPALDGGRFMFLIIEKIRRKPNNQNIENLVHSIGFALLMLLIVFITYRDFLRYGGGLLEKLKNLFS